MPNDDWKDDSTFNIPEGEFCVYGTVYADPEHADKVEAVYRETTKRAEAEEGTLYYCICRDQDNRSIFHFFERYKSREAFQKHNDQKIIEDLINSGWMKDVKAVFAKAITP